MNRKLWIENLKGLSMLMVVVLHTSAWYTNTSDFGPSIVYYLSDNLRGLRMPSFFFVSGLLAWSMLHQGGARFWGRTGNIYLVYLFWTTLFALRLFVPMARGDGPSPTLELLLANAIVPTGYWYIWALPVLYVMTRALIPLQAEFPWLPLVVLAAISVFSTPLGQALSQIQPDLLERNFNRSFLSNAVWFYLGFVCREWLLPLLECDTPRDHLQRRILAAVSLAVALCFWGVRAETHGPAFFFQSAAFIAFAVALFRETEQWAPMRFLGWIGAMTLPIYLFHYWALSGMTVARHVLGLNSLQEALPAWVGIVGPLTAAVAITVVFRIIGAMIYAQPGVRMFLSGPLNEQSVAQPIVLQPR